MTVRNRLAPTLDPLRTEAGAISSGGSTVGTATVFVTAGAAEAAASAAAALASANAAAASVTSAGNSATAAAGSASAAATSLTNATTQATNALNSANAAATSATNAATSLTNATTQATNALNSANAAAGSATTATTQATNALNSANAAATSATNAATSLTNATTQATNALNSANAAATSATNSATSATNAAGSLTSFVARYLGAKTSNPTLDNAGAALIDGAVYWNSVLKVMRVYDLATMTWNDFKASVNLVRWKKTFAGGETSASGNADADHGSIPLVYTAGYELVLYNGGLLDRGVDYIATTGTTITGLSPAAQPNDEIVVLAFSPVGITDVFTTGQSDARYALLTSPNGFKNKIENGNFEVAQRGGGPFGAGVGFDRWIGAGTAGAVISRNVPSGGRYSVSLGRNSGATGDVTILQKLTTSSLRQLLGGNVTVSFEAQAVGGPGDLGVSFDTTDAENGYANDTVRGSLTVTAAQAAAFTKFSFTFALAGSITQLGAYLAFTNKLAVNNSSIGWNIRKVQVEVGTVATTFEDRPYPLELFLCRHHLWRKLATSTEDNICSAFAYSASNIHGTLPIQKMRAVPSLAAQSVGGYTANGTAVTATSITLTPGSDETIAFNLGFSGTPFVAGNGSGAVLMINGTSYLEASAEMT